MSTIEDLEAMIATYNARSAHLYAEFWYHAGKLYCGSDVVNEGSIEYLCGYMEGRLDEAGF